MNYLVYLGLCIIVTSTPGPAVLMAVKNGAEYGPRIAVIGVLGNVLAMLTLASISAAGLGAIILASATLYTVIKVVGGLYLIYLGITAWVSSSTLSSEYLVGDVRQKPQKSTLFRESYLIGVSNPKAIAFYTALFPQFIVLSEPVFPQFFLLSMTFALSSFAFLLGYASVAFRLKPCLEKDKTLRWFNRITGGVFVGFGAALVLDE